MDFKRYMPYYLLLAFLIGFVFFVFQSQGTAGGADDIQHYRYAKYAFENPGFFFDTKAKTLFTMVFAPVAQLGFNAVRVFNVLLGLLAALLTYLTARKLGYDHPVLSLFLLVFAPIYTVMMLTGMTEIPFSLLLILGIYLYFKDRSVWSAVVISLLPFVRTEGIVIFPLFILAYLINRQWKALPFLLTGFLLFSFAGSFYHGEFFWVITRNAYTGAARDIYGSGELLHFVKNFRAIFGVPLFVLIVMGLLYLPVQFFREKGKQRKRFAVEVLVGFLPFLAYFCAHSYVWWKGRGNSVGELRVISAVIPSAVLLALFTWNRFMKWMPAPGKLKDIAGIVLAACLVFIPFRVYRIPVPLGPTQELIREASDWVQEMGYAQRKIHFWDPFWWFFLDINPTDQTRIRGGVPDRNNPGNGVSPGSIVLWDAHFGPNEGRMPLERFRDNPDFTEIKSFYPPSPFQVLGGYNYEIHIFERLKNRDPSEELAVLEGIRRKEDSLYRSRLLQYNDYEPAIQGADSSLYSTRHHRSGSFSYRLGPEQEFLPILETTSDDLQASGPARISVSISHYFISSDGDKPLLLVLSRQKKNSMLFYMAWEIRPAQTETWGETVIEHDLPQGKSGSDVLKVYLWNRGGNEAYIDDCIIALKEPVEMQ